MSNAERVYRRTKAGQKALHNDDPSIPVEYHRVLNAIDGTGTHAAIVRGALRDYSETVVNGWLSKLEALGLVESVLSPDDTDLDFTGNFQVRALRAELERRKEETERIDSLLLR